MPSEPAFRIHIPPIRSASLYYFTFFAAQAAFAPFLAVYYTQTGLSGSEIGLLAAIGPLVSLLAVPAISAVADGRSQRIGLLIMGQVATALVLLLFLVPRTFIWFLPVVGLLSIVGGPAISIADGLVARMAARRGTSYGRMRMWGSLSWAIVAAGVGALWNQFGYLFMFPLAAVMLMTTIPFARRLEEDRSTSSQPKLAMKVVIGDIRLRVILLATFVLGLAFAVTSTFTGIYLSNVGGSFLVGLFSGVVALSELPIMHWSEGIMRRLGGPTTLVLSYILLGISYLGVAFTASPVLLLGIAVIQGLGFGLFLPITVRLVSDWGPPEWGATSQGLMNAGLWGLAPLIAGPTGGMIYDSFGPAAVFLACVGATLVAGLVVLVAQYAGLFKKRDERAVVAPLPD